MLMTMATTRML